MKKTAGDGMSAGNSSSSGKICPLTLESVREIEDRGGVVFRLKGSTGRTVQIYDKSVLAKFAGTGVMPVWPHNRQRIQPSEMTDIFDGVVDLLWASRRIRGNDVVNVGGVPLREFIDAGLADFFRGNSKSVHMKDGKFQPWKDVVKKRGISLVWGACAYWMPGENSVHVMTTCTCRGGDEALVIGVPHGGRVHAFFGLQDASKPYDRRGEGWLLFDHADAILWRSQSGGRGRAKK